MFTKNSLLYGFQFFVSGLSCLYFWSFLRTTFVSDYFLYQTNTTQIVGFFVFLMFAAGIDVYRQKLSKND